MEGKDLVVKGGPRAVRGRYVQAGEEDGVACYNKPNTDIYIMRNTLARQTAWWISRCRSHDKAIADDYFFARSSDAVPPATGWTYDDSCGSLL
eukprot:CAMPEP_0170169992 /NCGR_PEP_ID=MMETSP0040_2-20121228/2927_1 /TAXON_ID=641309 /ORGANISM="Lotharella oceanica, Strain CCMP622" /LENGTH=92 /DNA_ID=CAMNT_0010409081 /DNA_START=161 /DNA_END=439 /DNA_ORIENTATION=-